jgi:transposase
MEKEKTLRENGTYNVNHKKVKSRLFESSQFFDARDIVQVKYEMLREVTQGGKSVTAVSEEYGFSRETLYENKRIFEKEGITGLLPKKKGPKGSHKLSGGESFINEYIAGKPEAKSSEVAEELEKQTGIKLHPRTIQRYMRKKK